MNYFALVPAGGSGSRMGAGLPKQYLPLAGRPLIWHSVAALARIPRIAKVFVVIAADDAAWPATDMAVFGDRLGVLRCGGDTRAASVTNGLRTMMQELPDPSEEALGG